MADLACAIHHAWVILCILGCSVAPNLYLTADRSILTLRHDNQIPQQTNSALPKTMQPGRSQQLHASPSARKLLASSRTGTSVEEGGQAQRGRPGTQEPPASKLHALSQDQKCERMRLG